MSFLKHLLPGWKRRLERDTVNTAILQAIGNQLSDAEKDAIEGRVVMSLKTSTGRWLNIYGDIFGVYRQGLESDEVYRQRILNYITLSRGTIPAIISASRNFLNDYDSYIEVYEPYRNTFRLNNSKLNSGDALLGNYYRYAIIDIRMGRTFPPELIDIIKAFKPAGVDIRASYIPNRYADDAPIVDMPVNTSVVGDTETHLRIMNGMHDWIRGHLTLTEYTNEQPSGVNVFQLNNDKLNSLAKLTGSFGAWSSGEPYNVALYSTEDLMFTRSTTRQGMQDAIRSDQSSLRDDNIVDNELESINVELINESYQLEEQDLTGEGRNLLTGTSFKNPPRTVNTTSVSTVEEGYTNEIQVESGERDQSWGIRLNNSTGFERGETYTLNFDLRTVSISQLDRNYIVSTGEVLPNVTVTPDGQWYNYTVTFTVQEETDSSGIVIGSSFSDVHVYTVDGGTYTTPDDDYSGIIDGGRYRTQRTYSSDGGSFNEASSSSVTIIDGGSFTNTSEDYTNSLNGGTFQMDGVYTDRLDLGSYTRNYSFMLRTPKLEEGDVSTEWKPAPEDDISWFRKSGELQTLPLDLSYLSNYNGSTFFWVAQTEPNTSVNVSYNLGDGTGWRTLSNRGSLNLGIDESLEGKSLTIRVQLETDNPFYTPVLENLSYEIEGTSLSGYSLGDEFFERTGHLDGYYAYESFSGVSDNYLYFGLDLYQYLELNFESYLDEVSQWENRRREHYLSLVENPVVNYNISVPEGEYRDISYSLQIFNLSTYTWENLFSDEYTISGGTYAMQDGEYTNYIDGGAYFADPYDGYIDGGSYSGETFTDVSSGQSNLLSMDSYLTDTGLVFIRAYSRAEEGTEEYEFGVDFLELGFNKEFAIRPTTKPYFEDVSSTVTFYSID